MATAEPQDIVVTQVAVYQDIAVTAVLLATQDIQELVDTQVIQEVEYQDTVVTAE